MAIDFLKSINAEYAARSEARAAIAKATLERRGHMSIRNRDALKIAREENITQLAIRSGLDAGCIHDEVRMLSNLLCFAEYGIYFEITRERLYSESQWSVFDCTTFQLCSSKNAIKGDDPFDACRELQRGMISTQPRISARSRVMVSIFPKGKERLKKKDDSQVIYQSVQVARAIAEYINGLKNVRAAMIDSTGSKSTIYTGELVIVDARVSEISGGAAAILRNLQRESIETDIDAEILEQIGRANRLETISNIVIIGRTGSGKSTLGNMLRNVISVTPPDDALENPFMISGSGSCTTAVRKEPVRGARCVRVWDTPGLADEYDRDDLFLQKIRDSLDQEGGLSAVIMCTETRQRFDNDEQRLLRKYLGLLPDDGMHRIFLVATLAEKETTGNLARRTSDLIRARVGIDIPPQNIFNVNREFDRGCSEIYTLACRLVRKCELPSFKVGAMHRLEGLLDHLDRIKEAAGDRELRDRLVWESSRRVRRRIKGLTSWGNVTVIPGMSNQVVVRARERDRLIGCKEEDIVFRLPHVQTIPEAVARYFRLQEMAVGSLEGFIRDLARHGFLLLEIADQLAAKTSKTMPFAKKTRVHIEMVDMKRGKIEDLRRRIQNVIYGGENDGHGIAEDLQTAA